MELGSVLGVRFGRGHVDHDHAVQAVPRLEIRDVAREAIDDGGL